MAMILSRGSRDRLWWMAEELIVVGAGGLGREVFDIAHAAGRSVAGYLDDNAPSLGPVDSADPQAGEYVVAVGDPVVRMDIVRRLTARDCRFTSVIHPTAVIGSRTTIETGTVIAAFAYVGPDARIGEHSVLNVHSLVGHDSHLGSFCVLSPFATVNGECAVEAGVFMGAHAVAGPRVRVGKRSKLAAGSVVCGDVEPGSLMVGNPARGRMVFAVDEG